jgi:hypothetical protein
LLAATVALVAQPAEDARLLAAHASHHNLLRQNVADDTPKAGQRANGHFRFELGVAAR